MKKMILLSTNINSSVQSPSFKKLKETIKKMLRSKMEQDIYLPVKNWPLFERMRKAGKIREIRNGVYELKEKGR